MNEIQIINSLRKIIKNPYALKLNDDVFFDKGKSLLASIDTYNEKIHYLNFNYPNLIIKKAIRSSISDILSKGADPKYLLISLSGSKKKFNKKNIFSIIKSIKQEQKKYNFSLIGGDTTNGTASSFTICTFSYSKKIIKRNNSKLNDDIYITGNIGDSSVGLSILKKKIKVKNKLKVYFLDKYFSPNIPYGFHKDLYKFANCAMDISDGLLTDLRKMLKINKNGFTIYKNLLPKSYYFKKLTNEKKIKPNNHLFKGDDYQILFTSKKKYRKIILKCANKWKQKVTRIGYVTDNRSNYIINNDKLHKINNYQGYIHNFN